MKKGEVKPITGEWLRKSQEDEFAIQAILKEKASYSVPCFLAQQMAEKCLKGFLAEHDLPIPKIHQLERLLGLCKEVADDFSILDEEAVTLTEYYFESRYPGDYPEDLNEKEAREAFEMALKIKNFVYEKLGL